MEEVTYNCAGDVIPPSWQRLLPADIALAPLEQVGQERAAGVTIYPPEGSLFTALKETPPEEVRAVILGQDPYHDAGQAMGLAFAVPPQCQKMPPSLRNILRELQDDLGEGAVTRTADIRPWARAGVLLLNTTLSVRAHQAYSHAAIGWDAVSDAIIRAVSDHCPPTVFILWGKPAQQRRRLVDESRHLVITSAHPSPLSAYRGFFGSRPFSAANRWLLAQGRPEIHWLGEE